MAHVSRLLSILQLSPENASAVETILRDFDALDTEKSNRDLITAEAVFPLVFGQDASIRSDPLFSERNNTVWLDEPWSLLAYVE